MVWCCRLLRCACPRCASCSRCPSSAVARTPCRWTGCPRRSRHRSATALSFLYSYLPGSSGGGTQRSFQLTCLVQSGHSLTHLCPPVWHTGGAGGGLGARLGGTALAQLRPRPAAAPPRTPRQYCARSHDLEPTRCSLAEILVLAGTAGAGRMAPTASASISARMKCDREYMN